MRGYYKIRLALVLLLIPVLVVLSGSRAGAYTYLNDFEGNPATWSEWSPAAQATTPSGRHFLGSDPYYGFSNETATLTLPIFPGGSPVAVSFDLYIIRSWDGKGPYGGPDRFKFFTGSGQMLLDTTFSIYYEPQDYPDNYPSGNYPKRTGAVENDTLGYGTGNWGDSVYHISRSYIHPGGQVVLKFQVTGLQYIVDESWGLDNVKVTVIPIPPSFLLLASGLVTLAGITRKIK